jgi:hypothetical protein
VNMDDLSYLTTEYARNKDIECYQMEAKERDLDREIRERCKQIIGTLDSPLPQDLKLGRIKDRAADINKLIEGFQ